MDEKPLKTLSTPSSVEDLQRLLDDYSLMNSSYVGRAEICADNYYIPTPVFNSISGGSNDKPLYLWEENADDQGAWSRAYKPVFLSNLVLDELNNISKTDQAGTDNVKGSALFFRAYYYYGLSQIYAKPYDESTANTDLGIPIRLRSNIEDVSTRGTLQQTYDRIISDLKESIALLPTQPLIKSRPSKSAVYGALAKVYLSIKEYENAGKYADLCIRNFSGSLLDFNKDITPLANNPIPFGMDNKEVIFFITGPAGPALGSTVARIDTNLYASYAFNDIRKTAYFRLNTDGSYRYKGNATLSGTSVLENNSIMLNEMYLIRAESFARAGQRAEALADLNSLMSKRFQAATFTFFASADANGALSLILQERRKELLFSGTRWTDLRRFRSDEQFRVIPKRVINGQTYQLLPNSSRYTLQIPQNVITLSGMLQND